MSTDKISLSDLLNVATTAAMNDIHTCMPAIVEEYDRTKQVASVQPSLKRTYENGDIVNLPIIKSVPVCFPRSGKQWIHFDLVKGDVVTLVFSERSLDKWKEKGDIVQPEDKRRFHLSDAYAIPGGHPKISSFVPNGEDGSIEFSNDKNYIKINQEGLVEIKNSSGTIKFDSTGLFEATNGTGTMKMTDSGKFAMTGPSDEVLSVLSEFMQAVISGKNLTGVGPLPLDPGTIATLTAIKTRFDILKE